MIELKLKHEGGGNIKYFVIHFTVFGPSPF